LRAVRTSAGRLTYADLDAKTDALRDCLASAGFGQGALAGVLLSRSAAVISSFLGVLKAGGAFVPLDPASPPDVILGLVRWHKLACVVSNRETLARFPELVPADSCCLEVFDPAINRLLAIWNRVRRDIG
jgi:non-ribosomal peptide synthetase component F